VDSRSWLLPGEKSQVTALWKSNDSTQGGGVLRVHYAPPTPVDGVSAGQTVWITSHPYRTPTVGGRLRSSAGCRIVSTVSNPHGVFRDEVGEWSGPGPAGGSPLVSLHLGLWRP